jgi:predicted transcriptional regulator
METNSIELVADIVSAYVAKNSVAQIDLPRLITDVYATLARLAEGAPEKPVAETKLVPAVSIRKSVTPDFIISLEDGKKFKSLKRHLNTYYDMTPEEYRAKWGLPADYPMVAPNYSKSRSDLAKQMGLGKGRKSPQPKGHAAPRQAGRLPLE